MTDKDYLAQLKMEIEEHAEQLNTCVFYMGKEDYEALKKRVKANLVEIQRLLPEEESVNEIIDKIRAITRKRSCLKTVSFYHSYLKILSRRLHRISAAKEAR